MKVRDAKVKIAEMQRTCDNLQKIMSTFSSVENEKENKEFLSKFYDKTFVDDTLPNICLKSFTVLREQIEMLEQKINEAEI